MPIVTTIDDAKRRWDDEVKDGDHGNDCDHTTMITMMINGDDDEDDDADDWDEDDDDHDDGDGDIGDDHHGDKWQR